VTVRDFPQHLSTRTCTTSQLTVSSPIKQAVPDWFASLDDIRLGSQSSGRRSNYNKGGQQSGIWGRDPRGFQQGQGQYGGGDNGYMYRGQSGGGGQYAVMNTNRVNDGSYGYNNNGYQRQQQQQQYPQQQQQSYMRQPMRQNDTINRFMPQYPQIVPDQSYMANRSGTVPVSGYYNPYPGYPTAVRDGMQMMTGQMGQMSVNVGPMQERPNDMYRMQQQQQQQQQRNDGYGGPKDARPYNGGQQGQGQGQVPQGYQYSPRGYPA
jgi:hypothetical protein